MVVPVRVAPRASPPPSFTAESVRSLRLEHAAFPELAAPGAVVFVPPGIDRTRRLEVLVFFHGFNGCALAVAAPEPIPCHPGGPRRGALDLINQVRASGRAVVLVIPQLAMEATRGDAGRLGHDGGLRRFLAEVLAAIEPEVGPQRVEDLGRVLFAVHSGGYAAALAALQRGGVDVGHIAMFDALYTGITQIGGWLEPGLRAGDGSRRFVSVYGASAAGAGSRELDRLLRGKGLAGDVRRRTSPGDVTLEESLATVALLRGQGDHQQVLRRNLAMVLRGAGLGARRP
ncbi:MAG: hypothetical protein R3A48_05380 [Polyangiales bacterium]